MFDYDKWQEIFGTIRKNKLRTFLTLLGIFCGMFILILLLGLGNSFKNGVMADFNFAANSGFLWGRRTTISYDGFQPGKRVSFDNSDTKFLRSRVREIENLAPRNSLGNALIGFKEKASSFQVYGDYPDYNKIEIQEIISGRYINQKDIEDTRKVVVIGSQVKDVLFGGKLREGEEAQNLGGVGPSNRPKEIKQIDPIGQFITIRKVNFKVVGVLKPSRDGNSDVDQSVFVPFSTFQVAFNFGDNVGWYAYSLKEGANLSEIEPKILEMLRAKNSIHPLDEDAIGHFNLQEEFEQINGLFDGLIYFVWFVGISTLFAGIIGISNIMLIIVKERTKEIGIRKALGATPPTIISLVIQESVFLTLIGGYVALIVGLLALEALGLVIGGGGGGGGLPFAKPEVDPLVPIGALCILIIGGAIAGILPAQKAAKVSPIEAIRVD